MIKSLKYYKNLDALRAFAALAVIVAHYFTIEKIANNALVTIAALGNTGVSLFFVLSGFVITRILLNTVNNPNYFRKFYIKRTLRIFPLYYFGLFIYFYIPDIINGISNIDFTKHHFYYIFYLQNFARTFHWDNLGPLHYWSLAVEEHFYLMWPMVVFFALKKNLKTLIIASFLIIIVTHFLRYYMSSNGLEINVFTFTRLDQLVFGGLIAIYELKYTINYKHKIHYLFLILFGLIGVFLLEISKNDLLKQVFKHTFFGFLYAGIILFFCLLEDFKFARFLVQNKIVKFLGKISYGIYIWHMLAIFLVDKFINFGFWINFAVIISCTIFISWVGYIFIERPFLKIKSKFE